MTPDDVPNAEMLNKPRLRFRLGRRSDPLSSGQLDSAEWYDVADLLEAAAAPASASELTGEPDIIAAFQREHLESMSAPLRPTRRRQPVRSRMLNSLLTGKIAAALAAAAVGATGAATAAYADALPDSVQNIAHHLIAAPPAHSNASDVGRAHGHQFAPPSSSPSATPTESETPSPTPTESETPSPTPTESESASPSPSASLDPAAFGLCTAWSNAVAHDLQDQVGFRDKLDQIAGGADSDDAITTFCATVTKPDKSADASDDAEASSSPAPTAGPNAVEDGHGHGHGQGHGNENAPGNH
ncbi:MAG TPA: hypothetical protein VF218_05845 [Acidothermaceae bacterium]|jgi:hypothetical protein